MRKVSSSDGLELNIAQIDHTPGYTAGIKHAWVSRSKPNKTTNSSNRNLQTVSKLPEVSCLAAAFARPQKKTAKELCYFCFCCCSFASFFYLANTAAKQLLASGSSLSLSLLSSLSLSLLFFIFESWLLRSLWMLSHCILCNNDDGGMRWQYIAMIMAMTMTPKREQ